MAKERGSVRSGDLVKATGKSRQAVHNNLVALCREGLLTREGAGRSAHYVFAGDRERIYDYALEQLDEALVWEEVQDRPPFSNSTGSALNGFAYAFTEMLNNAIDHSQGKHVSVRVGTEDEALWFSIEDDGIGALASVMNKFDLATPLEALQEISKGKTTTAPEEHSGEGLFFVSKLADAFSLESQELQWIVDNVRHDTAVGSSAVSVGTRVRFQANPATIQDLRELFGAYTTDLAFDTTQTVVKLFEIGHVFVSRSEAKRLLHNLERFRHVILDFAGVDQIGQGFADEVFRVWRRAHPEVRISTINTEPAVGWMVARAQRAVSV